MLQALIAYRFLLGIGIGAEYPSGSVACSENTEAEGVPKNRQQMYFQLATNSMMCVAPPSFYVLQGRMSHGADVLPLRSDFGFVIATFVPLVLLWICGEGHLRVVWRLSLGLGVIPPMLLLYFRYVGQSRLPPDMRASMLTLGCAPCPQHQNARARGVHQAQYQAPRHPVPAHLQALLGQAGGRLRGLGAYGVPPLPTQLHVARLTLPPPPPALLPAFFPGSLQEFIYDFIVRSLPSIPPSEVKG